MTMLKGCSLLWDMPVVHEKNRSRSDSVSSTMKKSWRPYTDYEHMEIVEEG